MRERTRGRMRVCDDGSRKAQAAQSIVQSSLKSVWKPDIIRCQLLVQTDIKVGHRIYQVSAGDCWKSSIRFPLNTLQKSSRVTVSWPSYVHHTLYPVMGVVILGLLGFLERRGSLHLSQYQLVIE
ncbi:hypothetical protein FIBSPDRAFT_484106 [Athelia psychrophila]|uniref:Uncharacterized protein n=1 Tax=Athelia psychrophila TaxID=1759441 RepID=A0A167TXV3_9AGAM|nr:hypothetical protein FIBSPDRAFT_484106 [Fibularhizoctonia sp. CBS 109695]